MAPMQLDLLSEPLILPEGMRYEPEIIPAQAESEIIEQVRGLKLREFEFQGYRGKRRVISFGVHYDFKDSRLEQTEEMPAFLLPLRNLAARSPDWSPCNCRMFSLPSIHQELALVGTGTDQYSKTS